MQITTRRVHEEEHAQVAYIDDQCFDHNWDIPLLQTILTPRTSTKPILCNVGLSRKAMLGYVIYQLDQKSRVTLEVLRVGVLPAFRGFGIGRQLIEDLWEEFSAGGREVYFRSHVPETNTNAQLFHRALRFTYTKPVPHYYTTGGAAYHFGKTNYTLQKRGNLLEAVGCV